MSEPAPPTQTARLEPLRLTSDPANLAAVRHAVESFALAEGFGADAVADIGLTLNEALANVIRHAYHGRHDRPIEVGVDCDGATLRVTIRDWGSGVNPDELPLPERDPMRPGGLGLICLRQLMDRVVYTPQPDGMLLTLEKVKR